MAETLLDNASDTTDHPIFNKLEDGLLDDIKNCLEVDQVSAEVEDSNGMTLLMHAAWKDRADMVQYIIDKGGDVNGGNHGHDYKALHFAALANAPEVCRILLEAGAKVDHENSISKTASAMAAFVGNHRCVAVINNFLPREAVDYFTRKQPLEDEAKLSVELAKPLYNLVMSMNIHPIKVALFLKENPILLENINKVSDVLELMSKREFSDNNEIVSLKLHVLHYITRDLELQQKKDNPEVNKKLAFIDRWIKSMLIGRETDGFAIYQENFLRQNIKEFPFIESQIFKILVTNFSNNMNYGEDIAAAEIINNAVNVRKNWSEAPSCLTCGEENAEKKCSICKSVAYCDQVCQKHHWFTHKKICPQMKIKYDEGQAVADTPKST